MEENVCCFNEEIQFKFNVQIKRDIILNESACDVYDILASQIEFIYYVF